jgi:hypothetical protein
MSKFIKGVSGNPKGRPKGKSKNTLIRDQLISAIEDRAPDVVEAVVKAALGGDMTAAKIIMDRLIPVQKAVLGDGGKRQPVVNITVGQIEKNPMRVLDVTPIKITKETN